MSDSILKLLDDFGFNRLALATANQMRAIGGGFLKAFGNCWVKADLDNRKIMRPSMLRMMDKYREYTFDAAKELDKIDAYAKSQGG